MHGCQGAGEWASVGCPQPRGDESKRFLLTLTPAQVLPQPTPNLRLDLSLRVAPGSTRSAKKACSFQGHSWGLLCGHQTSGCWFPDPQMGHGERKP